MSDFGGIATSLAVIASFVLIIFGIRLAVRVKAERLRGILMVVAGIVILGNVYLYTGLPDSPEPAQRTSAVQQAH